MTAQIGGYAVAGAAKERPAKRAKARAHALSRGSQRRATHAKHKNAT
jgi:hypothetical protein